ncbi:MAG: glutamate--cysteine ligase, partial [Congregibacter sp.]|nr:glutamate--cysteine ligase [Congregibacter sp.]
HRLKDVPVVDVVARMLPLADDGLRALGVGQAERDRYLNVIDARLVARRNGAVWQREATQALLSRGQSKPQALHQMLTRYRELSVANTPVAAWPLP